MDDFVIDAQGLGKRYLIGRQSEPERYSALRDVVGRQVKGFFRNASDAMRGRQLLSGDEIHEFWALRDLDFKIKRGEVVGIIGRNGAGKSTLLKVLSRITDPSEGKVKIRGRVASLLEVGTGFHPELTGRENIYLNGAILGMTRKEIARKFDEIVDFAEVEQFLDTPVKRYSSGMYVRLAFSVAAHLEPEVLVVDEVLAVGDMAFQRKCLGKMDNISRSGRTVLFVSHNMTTVENLCSRAIILQDGRKNFDGDVADAVSKFALSMADDASLPDPTTRKGNGKVRVTAVHVKSDAYVGGDFWIDLSLTAQTHLPELEARLSFYASNGLCVSSFATSLVGTDLTNVRPGDYRLRLKVPNCPLNEGQYTFNVSLNSDLGSHEVFDVVENARLFSVIGGNPFGSGRLPIVGATALPHQWELTASESYPEIEPSMG